jgi:transposase
MRRLRAARLLAKGIHQSQLARRVGVHRQSVSRWAQQLEAEALDGLKKAVRAGRRPRLSAEDLKKIECGLKRGPEALGYEPKGSMLSSVESIALPRYTT